MTAISPELVERMVKLVWEMARHASNLTWIETAKEIAALLPAPVDPDLLEVRAICRDEFSENGPIERLMLQCLKRGRELASDGWIVWRGGECPVKGERVEYAMRHGLWCKPEEADELEWHHRVDNQKYGTGMSDIIAYRIIKRAEGGV